MRLLIENRYDPLELITESSPDGKKKLFIEGIFLQAGIKNNNNRVYPPDIMAREVAKYTTEQIDKNKAFGELTHPTGPNINLPLVSHRCVSLVREGNNWIGKAIVMDTPNGNIVRGILESGGSLGTSSRALGTLKQNPGGWSDVSEDLSLRVAGDVVHDQSAPDAILRGIMESCDWIQDAVTGNWVMQEQIHETKKQLKKMSINEINEKKFMIFEHFLKSLNEETLEQKKARLKAAREDFERGAPERAKAAQAAQKKELEGLVNYMHPHFGAYLQNSKKWSKI